MISTMSNGNRMWREQKISITSCGKKIQITAQGMRCATETTGPKLWIRDRHLTRQRLARSRHGLTMDNARHLR